MERAGTHTDGPHIDLLRAAQLCHPRWNEVGSLTLHRREGEAPTWSDWKNSVWTPVLRPQLEAAMDACALGDPELLKACGKILDDSLAATPSGRSRNAGYLLAGSYTAPAGERFWKRTMGKFVSGEISSHLLLVMTLRAQTFHIPPWQVMRSYLLVEAHGCGRMSASQCGDLVADCEGGAARSPLLRVA